MKTPLLLLHGAIGSAAQLEPLARQLEAHAEVHLLNFAGHGGSPATTTELSIASCAEEVCRYLDGQNLRDVPVFGYSMGGYVALYLARHYPAYLSHIFTLGTKLHWDEATAQREAQRLVPEIIESKVPAFARTLAEMHGTENWKPLLQRTAAMMLAMGLHNPLSLNDYPHISQKVLLTAGDRDTMVTIEETLAVYRSLPNAALKIWPYTPHPIEKTDSAQLARTILSFLA